MGSPSVFEQYLYEPPGQISTARLLRLGGTSGVAPATYAVRVIFLSFVSASVKVSIVGIVSISVTSCLKFFDCGEAAIKALIKLSRKLAEWRAGRRGRRPLSVG